MDTETKTTENSSETEAKSAEDKTKTDAQQEQPQNAKNEQETKTTEKTSEKSAEKTEQKEQSKSDKEQELFEREKAVIRAELRIKAHGFLTEKGLDVEILDILNYENEENCKKSVETVAKVIESGVKKMFVEKYKTETPKDYRGSMPAQDLKAALAEKYN